MEVTLSYQNIFGLAYNSLWHSEAIMVNIGSGNCLLSVKHMAFKSSNTVLLTIRPLETNFFEIWITKLLYLNLRAMCLHSIRFITKQFCFA